MHKRFWPFQRWSKTGSLPHETKGSPIFWGNSTDFSPWQEPCFQESALQGYQKNAIVYRCVNLVAQSLSSVRLDLYHDGVRLQNHPLLKTLETPNTTQNYASFFESVVKYLLISGNSFIEAITRLNADQEPILELHPLRPDRIKWSCGDNGRISAYTYHTQTTKKQWQVDEKTGFCPILHMKLFHPTDDHSGMSPLVAAQSMIDLQNIIAQHNLALLKNAGCPSGALIAKGLELGEEQRRNLKESLDKLKGKGYGQTILLDGDFDWKPMSISPKEMDFGQGRSWAAREIAQVFGIPPMCIGILGDSTYSNYQEARLHLWEDTLLPMLDFILAYFNHWLAPLFGPNLKLTYNKDNIHALINRREKLSEHVSQMAVLTINEKREMLGYAPLEGGDILTSGIEKNTLKESYITHSLSPTHASFPAVSVKPKSTLDPELPDQNTEPAPYVPLLKSWGKKIYSQGE